MFRSSLIRFAVSPCYKLWSLNLAPCVIWSMTVLMVSATPGIVTTRISWRAETNAGYPRCGVVWITNRRQASEINPWSGYHSLSSPTMPGKSLCTTITHFSRVFPHEIDSGNPITTFPVTNLQSIATATKVKVFPRPISSAPSAPGIPVSQILLLKLNQMAQTWWSRILVPGRPGIEYLWPGTWSSVDWRIGWAFSSLTASSRHLCSNFVLIVQRTIFNTELVFAGLRTSSPSCTCSWTSLAPLSMFLSSWMISFSFSNVSWADGLIFRCSWKSSWCYLLYRQATIGTN